MTPIDDLTRTSYQQKITILFEKLHVGGVEERDNYIEQLRKLPRQPLLESLAEMLRVADGEVRCNTAESLLRIDAKAGVPIVLPLLADQENGVRWYLCGLLHDFGDERAMKPLLQVLLNDTEGNIRYIACSALEKIGDSSILPDLYWVHQNDRGADYEGRLVSEKAKEAIESILIRAHSRSSASG